MSCFGDNPEDDAPWSLLNLLALARGLRAPPQPARDPIAQLQAAVAQDARLPRTGGLFGSGYARYMADNAPLIPARGDGPAGIPTGTGAVFGPRASGLDAGRPEIDPAQAYEVAGPAKIPAPPNGADATVAARVAAFNRKNQADPGEDGYLDPDWVKAMIRVESGFDRKAYEADPMQVNKPGDWPEGDDYKAQIGLTKGVPPGQDLGVKAGLDWLESKAYHYDKSGRRTTFLGWPEATRRYNGGGDPHYLQDVQKAYRDIKAGR